MLSGLVSVDLASTSFFHKFWQVCQAHGLSTYCARSRCRQSGAALICACSAATLPGLRCRASCGCRRGAGREDRLSTKRCTKDVLRSWRPKAACSSCLCAKFGLMRQGRRGRPAALPRSRAVRLGTCEALRNALAPMPGAKDTSLAFGGVTSVIIRLASSRVWLP